MAKDPAFLFYPNDWIGGTMGMTFEEKGAYMELLMMQFNRGHMTTHMIGQVVGQIWVNISHKFIQDDAGLWYNVRLEEEQNKRKAFTDSRKNNMKGKNQYTKKLGHKGGHMTIHMENENENENIIKNNIPVLKEFLEYCKELLEEKYIGLEFSLTAKYESWIESGWKDGHGKKIKNWKVKIKNVIPYLKSEQHGNDRHERLESVKNTIKQVLERGQNGGYDSAIESNPYYKAISGSKSSSTLRNGESESD